MGTKQYPDPFLPNNRNSYYFTYTDPLTGQRKNKSTGQPKGKKELARRFIREFMDSLVLPGNIAFRQYAAPFFIWETCPRVRRLLVEE